MADDTRDFRLLMISAMYENGGNTTHRLLDGHPQLYVYPFESQVGTRHVQDHFSSLYPAKYRWPQFSLSATVADDYEAIIDEETKVRTRTPFVSKFRDRAFGVDDANRRDLFARRMEGKPRTRAALVEAFFRSTFDAWTDCHRSGREEVYVGYSPVIAVDAEKILADLPGAHVLEVVRNPWSAYADTKKRPVPLSIAHYMAGWTTVQQQALIARRLFPERLHVLRYEDIVADPEGVLGGLCEELGLERSATLGRPSWNGEPLEQVYPWGTIRTPTPDANRATAEELSRAEHEEIENRAGPYLALFGYA